MKVSLFFLLINIFLVSCPFERDMYFYSDYEPEIMERDVFEKSIELLSISSEKPQVKNAGKIYLQGDYMFIGDTNKGFYIYDNTNPKAPKLKAFLKVPGATDLAIRNGVFYVNQAVDLVAFSLDVGSLQINIHKRIRNTFPVLYSPDGYYIPNDQSGIVVDWHKKGK